MNMMAASIVGLLFLATIVTAYPYLPYTDSKEEQKNVQLSEEAVAAYLKSKMDKENLEPAKIMEYVVALIDGVSKKITVSENDCIPVATRTSDSLQKVQLGRFLDTIYPVTASTTPFTTFITPDHGVTMYVHETDPLDTYQRMLNDNSNALADIDIIWANFAPCPACTHALINRYNKPELATEKPTIYIARIVDNSESESNLTHVVRSLQCMAKLIHEGFRIEAWNYVTFTKPVGTTVFVDTCNTLIDTYKDNANFTSAVSELVEQVSFVQQLGENPHANSWCSEWQN